MRNRSEFVIIGAGLAGLAAAAELGSRAITVDQQDRPGGLVQTYNFGDGYWFDRVLHLLYCPDTETEQYVRSLLGECLQPCRPEAWVCTAEGTMRYPFQMHLGALPEESIIRCLSQLAHLTFSPSATQPRNYEETLLSTFGEEMCRLFLFPYNRKMWKRPLSELSPSGWQWTTTKPVFEDVVRGALHPGRSFNAYNSAGWYPRPSPTAELRGMEVLSSALSQRVADLRLNHAVTHIDLERREVHCLSGGETVVLQYERGVVCTLPPHQTIRMVSPAPAKLVELAGALESNRVVMAGFTIRGPRPSGTGHWRYYADETILFNRLVFMHEFDPESSPADGWSVMAEITEPSVWPSPTAEVVLERCRRDLLRTGTIPEGCQITGRRMWVIDPAYVVFTIEGQHAAEEIKAFLRQNQVEPLGRYGRWEYSSMAQVIRDGRTWAKERGTFSARSAN